MNLYLKDIVIKGMQMSQSLESNEYDFKIVICVICDKQLTQTTLDHKCTVRKANENIKITLAVGNRN